MSYDLCLRIDTGAKYPPRVTETRCPTYNLYDMFALALGRPIRDLDGMLAADAVPILKKATASMKKAPAKFKRLNPVNGWGSYEGALESLCWLLEVCQEHPKATVSV